MTLSDIGRMLRLANVPQSKTVQTFHPRPTITLHVPAAYMLVCRAVVDRLSFVTDNITVTMLDSKDVKPGQHVYVKVTGNIVPFNDGAPYDDAFMPVAEIRRQRMRKVRTRNANVVVECASVAS